MFTQRYFHFGLCVFKATRLNGYSGLLAAAIPAVIGEPELAFDAQKWRDPKRYGMISHIRLLPQFVTASVIITFGGTRAQ